ncbi:MAG: hypothetical protein IID33_16185, partial [Planctomycetes bacterium]|nr:hypothetical protein [Planctomycetota bacterium]
PAQRGDGIVITEQTRTIDVDGSGVYDVEFDSIVMERAGSVVFELSATTRDEVPDAGRKLSDVFADEIDVRPWGMRIEAHASGVRGDSDFVEIELPAQDKLGELRDMRLTVAVGPSMQRWLIEEALEAGPRWALIEHDYRSWKVAPPRTHADTAAGLIGSLYAADYVRGQQTTKESADLRLLNERIAGLAAQLLAVQNDDGGWAWTGSGGRSDPWTSSHVAWGLGKARRNGHAINDAQAAKLTAYLQKAFADARAEQAEMKSVVLHGLAWVNKADFAHANRLYRNRQSLSSAALGHLALTFARLDRKSIAAELLAVLGNRMKEIRRGRTRCLRLPTDGCSAWMNSELEVTGLALLAQLSVDPRAANVKQMADFLTSSIRSDGWRPHKARGTIIAALTTYYARGRQAAAKYTLSVLVNGREVKKITSDDPYSTRIELSGSDLTTTAGAGLGRHAGKQRIDFKFAGRGEYAFAVTLSGFSKRYPTPREARNRFLTVSTRRVTPPPLEYRGRVVKSGFSTVERYKLFRNEARHLEVGQVASVRVPLGRYDASNNAAGDRDYVILQETIPAGFRLLPDSVSGSFKAKDYSHNVLTLYYGSEQGMGSLRYEMVATTPGEYRLPPSIMRSLYRPDVYHVNRADANLTVLPRGANNPDNYRMTPDELYNLGRLNFDDGDYSQAVVHLRKLLDSEWIVRNDPYRESVRMLLSCALAADKPEEIVDYFEILREKYLDLLIPFDEIVRIADAYARTGQHERAYVIHRATADASFALDAGIAGVLQSEG